MKQKNKLNTKKQITQFTRGLISNIIDFILFEATLFEEVLMDPLALRSLRSASRVMDRAMNLAPRVKKNAIYNARKAGWLKKDGKLTQEGRERLNRILPSYKKPQKWDAKWYLVIFDIPEKIKWKREILRTKLQRLGFGQLQASVWLSPYNYLGNVLEIIRFYHLEPFVILCETDKLGQEESRVLARKVWSLDKINKEYERFIQEYSSKEHSVFKVEINFYSILRKDPKLPFDLLPINWKGDEAYKLYRNHQKKL